MSTDRTEEKRALRTQMKRIRAEDSFRAERDEGIFENFFRMPIAREESFFIYRSFSTEADTSRIAERLVKEGKRVYFPRVEGREMVAVPWEGQAFVKNAYGILEPRGRAYDGNISVCVLPLLAADKSFCRLGYGGGYYDRFLSGRDIYKAGLCYDFQIVESVPCEAHDIRLDAIVTDKQTLIRRED